MIKVVNRILLETMLPISSDWLIILKNLTCVQTEFGKLKLYWGTLGRLYYQSSNVADRIIHFDAR
jgi:hypothetical protein